MSSNKTTITCDETLRNETNDVTKEALRNAAEKTGEVMQRLGLASGRAAVDTTEVKLPVSEETKEEKQKLQESYEKGKANARREKALLGDPKAAAESDLAGLSVLERAQLAADEVYRAAGETPVATDHEGGFLETATVMASNTVDLIKQAAAKTAEQATSAAAHVTQALDGGPSVDLSEIEQKRAQDTVNDMKAEQQELEDQAAKKKLEVKEEVVANRAAGKQVQEPTSVNFNDATSTSATGILKTVGDKVSETFTLVKGAVTGAAADTATTTTPTSTSTTPSNVDVVRAT